MSEYTPTTEEVRAVYNSDEFGHPAALDDPCPEFDRWLAAHGARIASEAAEAEREAMSAELRDYLRALWIVANRTEGGLRFSAREFLEVPDDLVLMIGDDIGSFDKVIHADRLAAEREDRS